jgi:glycosyltransferase involved in cell wall biosynthesis
MKILMLLDHEFPPDVRVENEARSLINAGHEVHLLSYTFGKLLSQEKHEEVIVHRFWIPEQVAKKMAGLIQVLPVYQVVWKRQIKQLLKRESFDAVHIHDLALCMFIPWLKEQFGMIVVADMHENYPYLVIEQPYMKTFAGRHLFGRSKWFSAEKHWLEPADKIICVAEEMRDRLSTLLSSTEKFAVVPNTIRTETFASNSDETRILKARFHGMFHLTYIGGLDPVRGIEYLIEACSLLTNDIPTLRVTLVGSGPSESSLQGMVSLMGLQEIILFEGHKPFRSVGSYIESANACVIPHVRSEQTDNSSPNKIFQYMYYGKPVISSDCRSLEKLVRETGCGVIFHDRDGRDLASKILFLFRNPGTSEELGRKGKNAVITRYNWNSTVTPLLNIYTS